MTGRPVASAPVVASGTNGLLGNSLWNVVGSAAPTVVAIPITGLLARALGAEKFGLLTLAWGLVGYVAVLDLGVSRSVCWLVAQEPGDARRHEAVVGTSLSISLAVSLIVGMVLLVFAEGVPSMLKVTPANARDATTGAMVVLLTLPLLTATNVLQAFLEGLSRFRELNLQRSVTGVLLSVIPLAFVAARPSFTMAMWGVVTARVVGLALAFRGTRARDRVGWPGFDGHAFRLVFQYGGWIAVSNFIYPLMGFVDRIWLSSRIGAAAVAAYSAPAELVSRATIVPVAIGRAIFPSLSARDSSAAQRRPVIARATLLVLSSSGPVALAFFLLSEPLLRVWLGAEIAVGAAPVLRILSVGYLLSALAQVPFSTLQARGHARATATVHVVETLPYFVLLFVLGARFGAVGVAWAWTARVAVDYTVLAALARWVSR